MEIGMEQLVWAIIFIVFIIITALKNKARKRPKTTTERTREAEERPKVQERTLGKYLENLFGVETSEGRPQIIEEEEEPEPLIEQVRPEPEKEKSKIGEFVSPLTKRFEKGEGAYGHKKKVAYQSKHPWDILAKKDLKRAIILSEIIGPPISKRKGHRLF